MDCHYELPQSFAHEEDVVGVQVATHPQSAGKLRRILWVDM